MWRAGGLLAVQCAQCAIQRLQFLRIAGGVLRVGTVQAVAGVQVLCQMAHCLFELRGVVLHPGVAQPHQCVLPLWQGGCQLVKQCGLKHPAFGKVCPANRQRGRGERLGQRGGLGQCRDGCRCGCGYSGLGDVAIRGVGIDIGTHHQGVDRCSSTWRPCHVHEPQPVALRRENGAQVGVRCCCRSPVCRGAVPVGKAAARLRAGGCLGAVLRHDTAPCRCQRRRGLQAHHQVAGQALAQGVERRAAQVDGAHPRLLRAAPPCPSGQQQPGQHDHQHQQTHVHPDPAPALCALSGKVLCRRDVLQRKRRQAQQRRQRPEQHGHDGVHLRRVEKRALPAKLVAHKQPAQQQRQRNATGPSGSAQVQYPRGTLHKQVGRLRGPLAVKVGRNAGTQPAPTSPAPVAWQSPAA